jgi:hypothetical protein
MLIAEVHQITAGNDFDGTVPPSLVHVFNGVKEFAFADAGGKFVCQMNSGEDPADTDRVRKIKDIRIRFGGQSSWTLHVSNGSREVLFLAGTTETEIVATDTCLELMPDEYLSLVTAGATAAMHCTVTYIYSRSAILGQ